MAATFVAVQAVLVCLLLAGVDAPACENLQQSMNMTVLQGVAWDRVWSLPPWPALGAALVDPLDGSTRKTSYIA
eukprot:10874197-Alexandrium_andersonii.AAC.1